MKAVSAKHNISEVTCYAWKRRYGGMDESEAKRLRALEEENARLKRLVADLSVQNQILKEVNVKNGKPVDQAAGGEAERGGGLGISAGGVPGDVLSDQWSVKAWKVGECAVTAARSSSPARSKTGW